MKSRLWYPQLDIASAARRFLRLLGRWDGDPLLIEKLFVFDYFLATPALINDIKMTTDLRKKLGKFDLPKKKDEFVIYPPSNLLFHSMIPIQQKALVSLVAKGVVDRERYEVGAVELTKFGAETADALSTVRAGIAEGAALRFLTELMKAGEFATKSDLRARTGLRYYD